MADKYLAIVSDGGCSQNSASGLNPGGSGTFITCTTYDRTELVKSRWQTAIGCHRVNTTNNEMEMTGLFLGLKSIMVTYYNKIRQRENSKVDASTFEILKYILPLYKLNNPEVSQALGEITSLITSYGSEISEEELADESTMQKYFNMQIDRYQKAMKIILEEVKEGTLSKNAGYILDAFDIYIRSLLPLYKPLVAEDAVISIVLDSKYVINGVWGGVDSEAEPWIKAWKKNNWKTSQGQPVKNMELWVAIDSLLSTLRNSIKEDKRSLLRFFWEKGHQKNLIRCTSDKELKVRGYDHWIIYNHFVDDLAGRMRDEAVKLAQSGDTRLKTYSLPEKTPLFEEIKKHVLC